MADMNESGEIVLESEQVMAERRRCLEIVQLLATGLEQAGTPLDDSLFALLRSVTGLIESGEAITNHHYRSVALVNKLLGFKGKRVN